jgi:hypothetical protein
MSEKSGKTEESNLEPIGELIKIESVEPNPKENVGVQKKETININLMPRNVNEGNGAMFRGHTVSSNSSFLIS